MRQERRLSITVTEIAVPEPAPLPTGAPLCAVRGGVHLKHWKDHYGNLGCVYCHPPAPGCAVELAGEKTEEQ